MTNSLKVSFLCVVVVAIQAVGQVRISSTKKLTNILLDGKTHKNDFKRDESNARTTNVFATMHTDATPLL